MSSNEQLCQIILKTIHKCRNYGPNKLNLWSFYHLTFTCDLDLQPTWTNVSNGISASQGEHMCHINLKFMHKWRSYGPGKSRWTDGCTHNARTHIHRTEVATTMSRSPQAGLAETNFIIWPSSVTLTLSYLNKCFIWHLYSLKRTTVPNYFEIRA